MAGTGLSVKLRVYFAFIRVGLIAINSALSIILFTPKSGPLFHRFGSPQTLLLPPKITLANQPKRPIVRPYW